MQANYIEDVGHLFNLTISGGIQTKMIYSIQWISHRDIEQINCRCCFSSFGTFAWKVEMHIKKFSAWSIIISNLVVFLYPLILSESHLLLFDLVGCLWRAVLATRLIVSLQFYCCHWHLISLVFLSEFLICTWVFFFSNFLTTYSTNNYILSPQSFFFRTIAM